MKSKVELYKYIGLTICLLLCIQMGFAQESKIENYRRWKHVSELLTAVKDRGVLLLRIQDFDNSKHYVKSSYESSTYKLYVKKIDKYNKILKEDFAKGFTFSKVYVFNSKLSKHVFNNEFDKIEFIDPITSQVKNISQDTPHIFAQIKDLKLSSNTNPLNLSYQRVIQILDRRLKKDQDVDLTQDFLYHANPKDKKRCSHVFEAAEKMSRKMDELLETSWKKRKRLKKQILSKHAFKVKDYNKKIATMKAVLDGKVTDQHKVRLNKEIEKYQGLIQDINQLEKELFEETEE